MSDRERQTLERHMLTTDVVQGCAYGGLGCLGEHMRDDVLSRWGDEYDEWPDWTDPPCLPVDIHVTTCACGASDAYGELHHADRCPLSR